MRTTILSGWVMMLFPAGPEAAYLNGTEAQIVSAPEPSTILLMGVGLFAIWANTKFHRI